MTQVRLTGVLVAAWLGVACDESDTHRGPGPQDTSPATSPATRPATASSEDPTGYGYTDCPENCCLLECTETPWITGILPAGDAVAPDAVFTASIGGGDYPALGRGFSVGELEIEGVPGESAYASDGKSMTFTPDAPLAPDTTYRAVAHVDMEEGNSMCLLLCPDSLVVEFATAALDSTP